MKRLRYPFPLTVALFISAAMFLFDGAAAAEELTLEQAVALVLEKSGDLTLARESTNAAYQGYRIVRSRGNPQLTLSTDPLYGIGIRRDYVLDDFPFIERTSVTHSINAGLEFSQLLPTGGSAAISLSDTFDYRHFLEEENLESSYQLAQRPQLTLQLTQPLFVGGRFIDGDLTRASRRISLSDCFTV